jgi:hypothetical protein
MEGEYAQGRNDRAIPSAHVIRSSRSCLSEVAEGRRVPNPFLQAGGPSDRFRAAVASHHQNSRQPLTMVLLQKIAAEL